MAEFNDHRPKPEGYSNNVLTRHLILNMHADGSILNSEESGLAPLQRQMDNHESGVYKPTGDYFDPLPHGYEDKYGKAVEY